MFSDAEVDEFRRDAEEGMVDRYTLFAPTGWTVVDGLRRRTPTQVQVDVPAKMLITESRSASDGGVDREVMTGQLAVPVGSPAPAVGWEYLNTAIGARTDPALAGRRWRVVPARTPGKTWTARRVIDVEEVSA